MRILFFLLTFFFFAMSSVSAKGDMVACTMEYAPVCAQAPMPECPKGMMCAQVMPSRQTYSNACVAKNAGATDVVQGACTDTLIVGNDSDIHGCKASAGYRWNNTAGKCLRPWESHVRILTVGPNYRSCIGVTPMQCLQVRSGKMGWQNFYNTISGFDYTPGYTYRLQVLETKVENPPADGSNRTYELIRILSQKGTPVSKNSHIQGTWKLVSFNGKDVVGNYTAMIESDRVSFRFCNTVFGSYSLSGNVFVAPAIASTKMYCEGESMILEDAFDLNDATYTLISTKSLPPIHTLTLKTKTGNTYTYTR